MVHSLAPLIVATAPVRLAKLLLVVVDAMTLTFGLLLMRKGYVGSHRRPYVRSNSRAVLHVGAFLVMASFVLSAFAITVWLLF